MRLLIKKLLRENLIKESVQLIRVNDIESDELYDSMINQSKDLAKGEIGFGAAEPFGLLIKDNRELVGATWLESSGNFTFHIFIKPEYRGKGLSKLLLDDLMSKYQQMKSYKGDDYKIMVNVVNDKLGDTLINKYGFEKVEDNGQGGMILVKN